MRNVMLVIRWQIIERDQGVGDIPFADFRHEAVRANTLSPASSLGDRGTKHSDQKLHHPITSPVSVVSAWLRLDKESGLGIRGLSSYHSQVESSVSATTALGRYHAEEASVVRS